MIHEEERKQTRLGLKILGGLAAGLLLLGAVLIVVDDPLEDDANLRPHFTPGGGKNNALAVFVQDIQAHPVEGYDKLPKEVKEKRPGTEAIMRAFVNKEAEALKAFDKLMASNSSEWRWPDIEQNLKITADHSYISKSLMLATVKDMEVRALTHEGKHQEAVRQSLRVARCGSAMLHSEGELIHWLIAAKIWRSGEAALESALSGTGVTPELLRDAQEGLTGLELRTSDLGFAYRAEVVGFRHTILNLQSLGISPSQIGLRNWESVLLKPHRTINAYQNALKPTIRALDQVNWAMIRESSTKLRALVFEWDEPAKGFQLSANTYGTKLLSVSLGMSEPSATKALATTALHRQTVIMLALRRFELEKGKLPAALDELIPQYLASVPKDPFDDAPMRWNATKQITYSVGTNLKDDGGKMDKYASQNQPDIGLLYWWAAPDPTMSTPK